MNEMSLSRLYRRLTTQRAQPAVSVDDLVAVAVPSVGAGPIDDARRARVVADLTQSAPQSDLARFLRALHPVSESVARDVRATHRSAHPMRGREHRVAAGARRERGVHRLRWAGGIAACLSIALGLWSWHHSDMSQQAAVAAAMHGAPSTDRIFVSNDTIFTSSSDAGQQKQAIGARGDELFRGHFSG